MFTVTRAKPLHCQRIWATLPAAQFSSTLGGVRQMLLFPAGCSYKWRNQHAQQKTGISMNEQYERLRLKFPLPVIATDALSWLPAFFVAGLLRSEVSQAALEIAWSRVFAVAAVGAVMQLACGLYLGIYQGRWQVAGFEETLAVCISWTVAAGVAVLFNLLALSPRVPTSIVGLGAVSALLLMVAVRMTWRLVREAQNRPDPEGRTRVLVFGAGEAGQSVIKAMMTDSDSPHVPVAVLDDNQGLQGRRINGVTVRGTREDMGKFAKQADLLLIAVPSSDPEVTEDLVRRGRKHGLEIRIMPSTSELLGMLATIDLARPVEITDLMGRPEVAIDHSSVAAVLTGKVVLVTGAGGSIGSELCRQILSYSPRRLVMLDRDETALQGVQLSVKGHGLLDDENLVLANIRDAARMTEVFEDVRPDVVFHAAALKHLPLLESHPREGLLTNVLGTRNVLTAAKAVGVDRFVNVSTDKAANPTSVLGTTKRLAEALTLWFGKDAPGEYLSVRFGNVLGSRGSVLPAFEKQIASGGPVTVTHPDVTRYFMSIPEASRLVLQSAAIGKTGETLVLDMGEPVKIVDLAKMLIAHHRSDAEIVFTGLRPNEKLHEVLGHEGEVMSTREHNRIWHTDASVWVNDLDWIDQLLAEKPSELAAQLMDLSTAVSEGGPDRANAVLAGESER